MKATPNRIVNYVLPSGPSAGKSRPMLIVHVWPDDGPEYDGTVQGRIFPDSDEDGRYNDQIPWSQTWVTSVKHDEAKAPGTWHWPAREG